MLLFEIENKRNFIFDKLCRIILTIRSCGTDLVAVPLERRLGSAIIHLNYLKKSVLHLGIYSKLCQLLFQQQHRHPFLFSISAVEKSLRSDWAKMLSRCFSKFPPKTIIVLCHSRRVQDHDMRGGCRGSHYSLQATELNR